MKDKKNMKKTSKQETIDTFANRVTAAMVKGLNSAKHYHGSLVPKSMRTKKK